MRNALVVLVPVCIGLSSGFIVPSSIQETTESLLNEKNFIICNSSKNMLQKNERFIRTANITNNNINTTQRIDNEKMNNDIYEYIIKKDVNLTERSFIYIKNLRSRISGQRFNRKNKEKSFFISIKNIFDDFRHRHSLGHVDKNIFNTRKIFDVSGHRCKGKSIYATTSHNNSQPPKDEEELFKFFGIPVSLYDLEDTHQNQKVEKDVRQTSYLNNVLKMNSHNEKRLYREPHSDDYEQGKEKKTKSNDTHESFIPSNDNSDSNEDGDEILDYLMNKILENNIPKNKNYIIRNGFHYCRDCIEENLSSPSSDMNCTCDLKKM